jgi:hypothetical protein
LEERSKGGFSFGFHWSKGKELIMVEKQWRLKKKQSKQAKGNKEKLGCVACEGRRVSCECIKVI